VRTRRGDGIRTATRAAARGLLSAAPAWLPWLGALVAAATIAAGLWLDAHGTVLGVPHPPFVGGYRPMVDPLVAVALPVLALVVGVAPRLLSARVRPAAFALAVLALTLAARLALAAARGGTAEWTEVFRGSFEAKNEYLPALAAFAYGPGFFLDRFAELVPALPVHAAGHPPGLLLVMHALAIDTPGRFAALCIGAGALSAPLTYALGRHVLDERGARMAALLMTLAPGALQFGVTSADAIFLTLGLLAAWPLTARGAPARAVGALLLAVGSLFAWSLLAVGAWAVLVAGLRDGARAAIRLALACGVALLAVQGALAAATGFDPVGAFRATEQVYRLGVASMRPYGYWLLGSPVAFLVVLGLPIAFFALRALGEGAPIALAIGAILGLSAVLGFTKAETERIWLFLAPYVCLAAAVPLARRPGVAAPLAVALVAQGVIWELLYDTVW
jgi:hypothetical protein